MKEADDRTAHLPLSFRQPGTGMTMTMQCWFCRKPREQIGGCRVGPLKLFKCAICCAARAES